MSWLAPDAAREAEPTDRPRPDRSRPRDSNPPPAREAGCPRPGPLPVRDTQPARGATPQHTAGGTYEPGGALGARQRWLRAVGELARTWPITDRPNRWRQGEATVRWDALSPRTPGD
ncbi:hypothetical protein JGS22_011335 [Streptomyces sp. P38-E01]|uniref:Uncharacterized protein n=1 Tax=Streptomyces tardus TaxID=2780544 RepID=A0A949N860_9ACTN|nr:hypothetical protein [Streptomyces tardus]